MPKPFPFEFTRQCTGDLGIRTLPGDEVVAMMFISAKGTYPVFDVRRGGPPTVCADQAAALNRMIEIALEK